jgi:DNA polymerase-3 subunit delta
MYQKEFENLLRNNNIPRALLLYGENSYLISLYVKNYIHLTDSSESLMRQYFDEYTFDSAKKYLSQSSLFGGTNLLIIKKDKKIPKKELDILISLVGRNRENYLIFIYEGEAKSANTLQKSFNPKRDANWIRVFEPNMRDSIDILQKKAQKIGLHIDYHTLQHLLVVLNNNISLSTNELDKLAILDGVVTKDDIDRLVYSTAPLSIDKLFTALFEKRPVVKIITKLMELGVDNFTILRSIQIFTNQLYMFSIFKKLHGHIDSKAILGYKLPKDVESQRANLALKINGLAFLKIFEHLLEVEIRFKSSSSTNKELILYAGFIKLQSYL